MFLFADYLVVLVSLARDEDYVARVGEHHRRLYRFGAVGDFQIAAARLDARNHVVENLLGVLGARIVGGENSQIGILDRYRRHFGTLGLVAVAAASAHDRQFAVPVADFVHGAYHVFECVGCVGVIDNRRRAVFRRDELETSG